MALRKIKMNYHSFRNVTFLMGQVQRDLINEFAWSCVVVVVVCVFFFDLLNGKQTNKQTELSSPLGINKGKGKV